MHKRLNVSPLFDDSPSGISNNAPGLVSSVNIGVFNLGNAIGAVIGGVALKYSYNIVPLSAALVGIIGLLLVFSQLKVKKEPQKSLA